MMRKELLRFAQRKCTHAMNETSSKEQHAMLLMLKLLELSISDLEARHGGKFTEGDDEARQHAKADAAHDRPSTENGNGNGGPPENEHFVQGGTGAQEGWGGGGGSGGGWTREGVDNFEKGVLAIMKENHRAVLHELRGVKYSVGLLERRWKLLEAHGHAHPHPHPHPLLSAGSTSS